MINFKTILGTNVDIINYKITFVFVKKLIN